MTKVGQISPPVKTQLGYHIIQLQGMKPSAYTPFDEVKDFIKQRIVQEKQNDVLEKYVAELKAKSKITINADLLKSESEKAAPAGTKGETSAPAPAAKVGEPVTKNEPPVKAEPPVSPQPPAKEEPGAKK